MSEILMLASGSPIRKQLLANAGVPVETTIPRIDETSLRAAMAAEAVRPRDMADHLAEAKARKVSGRISGQFVLGCDQVLEHEGEALGKAGSPAELRRQLCRLRGDTHTLWSAAVIYKDADPIWRHIGKAQMTMDAVSDDFLDGYLARNAHALSGTVGGYQLEGEGVRLFTRVDGDYFTVLGIPLLAVLRQLVQLGVLER